MTEHARRRKADTARMLRTLRTGDRVTGTTSSAYTGRTGTVLDPDPFMLDGIRRVRVSWDDGPTVGMMPSSIAPVEDPS